MGQRGHARHLGYQRFRQFCGFIEIAPRYSQISRIIRVRIQPSCSLLGAIQQTRHFRAGGFLVNDAAESG